LRSNKGLENVSLLGNLVFKQKIKLRKLQRLSFIFEKPLTQRIQMWKNIC